MIKTDSRRGRVVLMMTHCAGMLDLVALPVWVGALMAGYRFDPQQAGGLVTLFLLGAVVASALFAPRFNRVDGRLAASLGFGVSAVAFLGASASTGLPALAVLHALGGFAAGTGLSFTHGTIGRSANPHRLFGMVGMALGIFSVLFLGGVPHIVSAWGAPSLFKVFAVVMAVACVAAVFGFPLPDEESVASRAFKASGARMPRAVWFGIGGVSCLALVQAMTFSFVERMGTDRGFGVDRVTTVLVAIGLLTIFPALLAALLQKRLDPRRVVVTGAVAQALLALVLARSSGFVPYAICAALLMAVILFTHTFAFGQLARLDVTGRAVAATPAMLMTGSAIGPILGGTIVKGMGYGGLGLAAVVIDAVAFLLFRQMNHRSVRLAAARTA